MQLYHSLPELVASVPNIYDHNISLTLYPSKAKAGLTYSPSLLQNNPHHQQILCILVNLCISTSRAAV